MKVKMIGGRGQISLGKEFVGRTVTVEKLKPGVWIIKTAKVIPDHELWLNSPKGSQESGSRSCLRADDKEI